MEPDDSIKDSSSPGSTPDVAKRGRRNFGGNGYHPADAAAAVGAPPRPLPLPPGMTVQNLRGMLKPVAKTGKLKVSNFRASPGNATSPMNAKATASEPAQHAELACVPPLPVCDDSHGPSRKTSEVLDCDAVDPTPGNATIEDDSCDLQGSQQVRDDRIPQVEIDSCGAADAAVACAETVCASSDVGQQCTVLDIADVGVEAACISSGGGRQCVVEDLNSTECSSPRATPGQATAEMEVSAQSDLDKCVEKRPTSLLRACSPCSEPDFFDKTYSTQLEADLELAGVLRELLPDVDLLQLECDELYNATKGGNEKLPPAALYEVTQKLIDRFGCRDENMLGRIGLIYTTCEAAFQASGGMGVVEFRGYVASVLTQILSELETRAEREGDAMDPHVRSDHLEAEEEEDESLGAFLQSALQRVGLATADIAKAFSSLVPLAQAEKDSPSRAADEAHIESQSPSRAAEEAHIESQSPSRAADESRIESQCPPHAADEPPSNQNEDK